MKLSSKFSPKLNKAAQAVLAGLLALSISATPALACTQVYMGSDVTTNGDVYWGRSEDYANRYGKIFGIEPASPTGKLIQSYENDTDPAASFSYKIDGPTFRYTYVRDTPDNWTEERDAEAKAYSEAGTNEKGVSISSTLTTDMNEKIDAVDPREDLGIGEYSIADFVLSQASTAREGVELLGKVIDEKGSQDTNQIVIGDATETWIFQQLSGHEWLAVKLADDIVSINPNMDDLQFVADLDDTDACLHSATLVETAKKADSYVETDGAMNVAASYGTTSEDQGAGQNTRYVQGHKYFGEDLVAGTDYEMGEKGVVTVANPQLFFKPAEKVDTFAALRSVATRGEGTDVDANANPDFYAIGNNRNTESHIFQVRADLADQPDIATIQWESLSRAEFSIFVPSYSALLTEVNPNLYPSDADFDISHVGEQMEYKKDENGNKVYSEELQQANEATALEDAGNKALDYVFMDLNTLAYNHRDSAADGVHAYLDALQKDIIAQQEDVDAQMQALPADQREAAANKAHDLISNATYEKCNDLLGELRSYVKAGDFTAPFAASDLAEDGTLKEALTYADDFKAATSQEQESATETEVVAPAKEKSSTGTLVAIIVGAVAVVAACVAFARRKK